MISGRRLILSQMIWSRKKTGDAIVTNAYYALLKALTISNRSFSFNLEEFIQTNSILAFDATPSGNSAQCEQISVPVGQQTSYNVTLNFAESLPEPVQLFVLLEYENVMTVDINSRIGDIA